MRLIVCSLVLVVVGCGPGKDDGLGGTDGESAGTGSTGGTTAGTGPITEGTSDGSSGGVSDSAAVTSATAGVTSDTTDGTGYPPGCTDGGTIANTVILDETTIRISDNFFTCDEPIEDRPDCAFPYFEATLILPSTSTEGMWTLPHPDVSLTIVREWPMSFDQVEGCACEDTIEPNEEITTGTITYSQLESGDFAIDYGEDLGYPALSGLSSIVYGCG